MEIIPYCELETYSLRDHLEPEGEDIFKCQGLRPRNREREVVNFKDLAIIKKNHNRRAKSPYTWKVVLNQVNT